MMLLKLQKRAQNYCKENTDEEKRKNKNTKNKGNKKVRKERKTIKKKIK